jgi:chloramphenicol-sensitive protein RarD
MHIGVLSAFFAYVLWGLFPIYFKALQGIAPTEVLAHRVLWSLVLLVIALAWRRQWTWLGAVFRQPRVLAGFAASALLLSLNWGIYIWAVGGGRVIDASLGYFINPLVNILLGFLLLRERLRPLQWIAVALAAAGVAWLTWQTGHPPWIGLTLGVTFGIYGLLRKTAALGALEGLSLETLMLLPLALGYLAFLAWSGRNGFIDAGPATKWLLAAAGPITAVPLLLFATSARRISLSLLGLLQYMSPTIQLLLGVWLYHEPFGGARLAGFAMIWAALALYTSEGLWRSWASKPQRV